MKGFYPLTLVLSLLVTAPLQVAGQCSVPNNVATTCSCLTPGATDCDLLPDMMISWKALQTASSGPSEYGQTGTNAARLRVTGSTPNIGHGPLETRGVNSAGLRTYICGTDTIITSAADYNCANGMVARQVIYQRIYHKNGSVLSFSDVPAGVMTYHDEHSHQHVNDWSTMSLRLAQPGVSDPRLWPVVATGGKVGYCLINLFTCSGSTDYCRTSHLMGQGSTLNNASFGSNYDLGFGNGCTDIQQGIKVGNGDTYSESLDGMWINLMPGLCNGQYQIVADVDPNNNFIEENDENNYTSIPFNLTLQTPANSGGTANILSDGPLVMGPGESRILTASPGTAYLWSTGATTRSITVNTAGGYSCTVTCPCGSLSTPTLNLTTLAAPSPPIGTGATIIGTGSAQLAASGSDLHWFDASNGGNEVGTGSPWNTPVISSTTDYWVEARNTVPAVVVNAGRPNNSGGGAYSTSKQWLLFDAYEPFRLESFKVYANSIGNRHFVLVDRLGNLIAEKFIEIPVGMNTITVDWDVPAGVQHKIAAYDDNSEVVRDLWRSDGGSTYPYAIGTMGSITGASNGTQYYYYLYDWVVRKNAVVATSARTMVTATVNNAIQLDLRVMLEGPYDQNTQLMRDDLRTASLIPSTEPYTGLGYTQVVGGGEVLTPGLLVATGNDAIVDWVRIELRSSTDATQVLATKAVLLKRNGLVIDGLGGFPQFNVPAGPYYVVVRHRNHLGAMTAAPITLTGAVTTVDLTQPGTATWGTDARKNVGGTMVLWTGNARIDNTLKYAGGSNDRDEILVTIGGTVPTATMPGYLTPDVTMDGLVKYAGGSNDRDPILVNVGGAVPTATRTEQVP